MTLLTRRVQEMLLRSSKLAGQLILGMTVTCSIFKIDDQTPDWAILL